MDHIEAARKAVERKYGAAYGEIAVCAALAASSAIASEQAAYQLNLTTAIRYALQEVETRHAGGDLARAEVILGGILKNLEGK